MQPLVYVGTKVDEEANVDGPDWRRQSYRRHRDLGSGTRGSFLMKKKVTALTASFLAHNLTVMQCGAECMLEKV